MNPGEGDALSEVIGRFTSHTVSAAAGDFAKEVTRAACPESPGRAKAFLFAASRLGAFGEAIGLELSTSVLLRPSVIERCCLAGSAMSGATRRTLRTNLRAIARRVGPAAAPIPVLSRERAKAPYSPGEIAAYLALSDAQPTALRRARANALICLGVGAGLVGGELRHVRGTDVVPRSGGVLVVVSGRRPRAVPVLVPYHGRLLRAAGFFSEAYLVSGRNPESHNVTNPLIRSLSGGKDVPRLDVGRLRSSWLVTVAEAIGLKAFMDAAGVSCTQRLGDLVANLEAPPEPTMVALLGGAR